MARYKFYIVLCCTAMTSSDSKYNISALKDEQFYCMNYNAVSPSASR